MLIVVVFFTGLVVGLASSIFKTSRSVGKVLVNILFGFLGALAGAFSGFGDAPFLLKYNFFNTQAMTIIGSIVFVLIAVLVQRAMNKPRTKDVG